LAHRAPRSAIAVKAGTSKPIIAAPQVARTYSEDKCRPANAGQSMTDDRFRAIADQRRSLHRRLCGVEFNVIDVVTGRTVDGGEGLPYDYARYVASVRNGVGARFLIKRI
jgi:hypothetical protein